MSLKPIRSRRHRHYRSPRLEGGHWGEKKREWKPPSKRQVKIIVALTLIIAGIFISDQAAKAVLPNHPSPIDPNTIIWRASDPNSNGAEFNFNGFTYTSNCKATISCLSSYNANSGSFFHNSSTTSGGTLPVLVNAGEIIVVTSQHYNTQTISDSQGNTFTKQVEKTAACCNGFNGISTIWTAAASTGGTDTVSFSGAQDGTYQATASSYGNILSINGTQSEALLGQTGVGADVITFTGVGASDFVVQGQGAYFSGVTPFTEAGCSANPVTIGTATNGSPNGGFTVGIGVRNFGNSTGGAGTVNYCISFTNGGGSCGTGGCTIIHTMVHLIGKPGSPLPSVAITKAQIGDLSVAAGKTLGFNFTWAVSNPNTIFGMFLTTNNTIPLVPNWSPYNDTSVTYLQQLLCTANCNSITETFLVKVFFLRTLGQNHNIKGEDSGCSVTGSSSSCFLVNSATLVSNPAGVFNYNQNLNNFTGTTTANQVCSFSGGVYGGVGCSWTATGNMPNGTPTVNTNIGLPFFQFSSQQYYLGFFTLSGTTAVQYGFQNLNAYTYNTGTAVNTPPNIDTTGFFGPVIKALINLGIWMFNEFLIYIGVLGPAMASAFAIVETFLVNVLNAAGNALGLGNIGTIISTLISQLVSFFTNQVPTALSNLPTVWARFFDTLAIIFPWLPIALSNALNILTLGVNAIVFLPTIVGFVFQFVSAGFVIYFILFWFIYTGDDALGGALAFFESAEWLVFGMGVKYLALTINFAEDIITAMIGLIPKPFIQMVAHKIPRLPIIEVNARFVNPSFDLAEIANGNMFSILLWITGILFLDWYESFTPALPGSLGVLLPATLPSLVALKGFLPLLEVLTAFTGLISFLVFGFNRLSMIALDIKLPGDISPGRRISGGLGGITIRKGGKRFQGLLEKRIQQRKIAKEIFEQRLHEGRGLEV